MVNAPSSHDICVLASYQFETKLCRHSCYNKPCDRSKKSHFLAIHTQDSKGLAIINKKELKIQDYLAILISRGPLAHLDPRFTSVVGYLNQYDWQDLSKSYRKEDRQAFQTVCEIAARAFYYSKETELWDKVSKPVETDHGIFYLNPACTRRIFEKYAEMQMIKELEKVLGPVSQLSDFKVTFKGNDQSAIINSAQDVNKFKMTWSFVRTYDPKHPLKSDKSISYQKYILLRNQGDMEKTQLLVPNQGS